MALRVLKALGTAVLLGFSLPLGKTLSIHEGEDDTNSNPSDNAVTKLRGDGMYRTSLKEDVVVVSFVGNDGGFGCQA